MRSVCLEYYLENTKLPFEVPLYRSVDKNTEFQRYSATEHLESENNLTSKIGMTILDQSSALDDDGSGHLCYDGFGNVITDEIPEIIEHEEDVDGSILIQDIGEDTSDKLNDLTWLCNHDQSAKITLYPEDTGLSQLDIPNEKSSLNYTDVYPDEERLEIEEEIKRKFAELEELMDKIKAVKHRKRRKRYEKKRHGTRLEGHGVSGFINIIPIERERRLAKPIRNALLIRSAMKKTWKGSLGSCCGLGCWANWKWVNLRHVMSDYE